MNGRVAAAVARVTGLSVVSTESLGGGDLSQVLRARLADGTVVVAKCSEQAQAEARMLRAIAATGAAAPAVVAVDETVLVIETLADDSRLGGAWRSLGQELAKLHAAVGPRYGWEADHAFGPVSIPNGWSDDWPEFWAERRLLCHVHAVDQALAKRLEALARQLPDRVPVRPRASLLHGDLWSGNVLAADGAVTGLIDPACYYGHAEVDFAMLALFGAPGPELFDQYGEPESGFDERQAIYQLWPALVHLRLFGTGYRPLVDRLLAATGV
jgi:fructosamine-3-kinase